MAAIADFKGMQYPRDGNTFQKQDYDFFNQQYATSSYQTERDLNPAYIFRPRSDDDVIKAIQWATAQGVAIAIKSGGHQYSGACSTGGKNVQIDLSDTYKDLQVLDETVEDGALVLAGVSNHLQDFLAYLGHNGLFVPTGQCAYVAVGGHGQTGGYGQMGRSFGLFGDHIRSIRLIDSEAQIRELTEDDELFNAILGGSPGNFGIVTHYTVQVHQASSYMGTVAGPNGFKGPHMMKALFLYDPDVLTSLLGVLANMSDKGQARGFDLCISVLSTDFPVTMLFPDLTDDTLWQRIQKKVKRALADDVLNLLNGDFPATILVYASWCPFNTSYDATVDAWFQQFRDVQHANPLHNLYSVEQDIDMAKMASYWVFPKRREFDLPYVKRTYTTNSTSLVNDGWVKTVVERINMIYNPDQKLKHKPGDPEYQLYDHCKLAVQIQVFGGAESQFYQNRNNGLSYSWRDSTVVQTMDCFHDPQHREYALQWQKENDGIMNGPTSPFSKKDRRVLWGSWGDWNMANVWQYYYEDAQKYAKLGQIRAKADPRGTFTANPFAVAAITRQRDSVLQV